MKQAEPRQRWERTERQLAALKRKFRALDRERQIQILQRAARMSRYGYEQLEVEGGK